MDAASPSSAGVRSVAEEEVVARVGVIVADAGEVRVTEFIRAGILIVAIRIGLALALGVVELALTGGLNAGVQGAGDAVVTLHRGAVTGAAGTHVVDGAVDPVDAGCRIVCRDAGSNRPDSVACIRSARIAVIGAGRPRGIGADVVGLVAKIATFAVGAASRILEKCVFGYATFRVVADIDAITEESIISAGGERWRRSSTNAARESYIAAASASTGLRAITEISINAAVCVGGTEGPNNTLSRQFSRRHQGE